MPRSCLRLCYCCRAFSEPRPLQATAHLVSFPPVEDVVPYSLRLPAHVLLVRGEGEVAREPFDLGAAEGYTKSSHSVPSPFTRAPHFRFRLPPVILAHLPVGIPRTLPYLLLLSPAYHYLDSRISRSTTASLTPLSPLQ